MSDWDSVTVIGSKTRPQRTGVAGGNVPTAHDRARAAGAINEHDRKTTAGRNTGHVGTDHAKLAKLDRENEVAPPSKVPPTVGKAISQARADAGLTQKELATKIAEKPQVIADFEASRVPPNPQVLGKLERALKVKLRGKDIGAKLEQPSKKK
ncbi:unnamed protein product [Jaminaea pallidilutea]